MDCQRAREALLTADDLRSPAAALRDHLERCAACRLLSQQLARLEQDWRDLPTPASADASRLAFLDRLPGSLPAPVRRPAALVVRWLVAALLLLAVGSAAWLLSTPRAVAGPPFIERLVDWNLELAEAGSLAERQRLYASQQAAFQAAAVSLPAEDRELASLLLENGSRLAAHDDPIAEAERFSAVADKLVEKLHQAALGKDEKAIDRYARLQTQVAQRGVGDRLAKIEEAGVLNFESERRLEKVILRDAKRRKQLIEMLEREPELKRKEIRQELDLPTKVADPPPGLSFDFDLRDRPAVVGQPTQFRIRLANRGAADLVRLQLVITLPDELEVLDTRGTSPFRREGQQLISRAPIKLPVGQETDFVVEVKAVRAGAAKCRAELRLKQSSYRPVLRDWTVKVVAAGS
ncbi:MAG: hypothetical protein JNM56_28740 [Planctomycetia bacterium]|nr:hypothetical protein [Planctomycetia bacterium]